MINHYEVAYRDAREVLHHRNKKVSEPIYGLDGLRYCPVDGMLLTDRDVLKEAWGTNLADEILREWTTSDSLNCSECNRLWHEYLQAAADYRQLFRQQKMPELAQKSPALAKRAETWQDARRSLKAHTTIHRLGIGTGKDRGQRLEAPSQPAG